MKFKVGDHVRIFDRYNTWTGTIVTIIDQSEPRVKVQIDEGQHDSYGETIFWFQTKQLRKLKKKEPRRRIWIRETDLIQLSQNTRATEAEISKKKIFADDLEFIEVRKKEENK